MSPAIGDRGRGFLSGYSIWLVRKTAVKYVLFPRPRTSLVAERVDAIHEDSKQQNGQTVEIVGHGDNVLLSSLSMSENGGTLEFRPDGVAREAFKFAHRKTVGV